MKTSRSRKIVCKEFYCCSNTFWKIDSEANWIIDNGIFILVEVSNNFLLKGEYDITTSLMMSRL